MEIKSFSRKQAGVIYANVKRGTIKMAKEAVSEMYDMVGEAFVSASDASSIENRIAAIKNAVDFIFAGDIESAQASVDRFSCC